MNEYLNTGSMPSCAFKLASHQDKGVSSSCQSVEGKRVKNLADCEAAALSNKANTFNWKGGWCYSKKCDDVKDFKPATNHGGWNIYTLECESTGKNYYVLIVCY